MRILLFAISCMIMLSACQQGDGESTNGGANISSAQLKNLGLDTLLADGQSVIKVMKGKIGNSPIEMQMYIDSNRFVRGSYFYEKYQTLLHFKGLLSNDGRMTLKVFDITKEEVENFKGRINPDWSFDGTWYKVEAGTEKLDFSLASVETPDFTSDLQGTYNFDNGSVQQTLAIRNIQNNQFEFQLVITSPACTGEIEKGIALFHSAKNANFYGDEDCYINFDLKGNIINVGGLCTYFHGMKCSFDGSYKKTSIKVEWIDDFYLDDDFDENDILELGD